MVLDIIFNVVGTIGVGLILIAYFLVQNQKIKPDELKCPLINLIGAILILISLLWHPNVPSIIIEICWIAISIYSIIKIISKRKK